MLEERLKTLEAAVKELTVAIISLKTEGTVTTATGPVPVDDLDGDDAGGDDLDDPAPPAAKKVPAKKAGKPAPPAEKPAKGPKEDHEYLRNFVKNERERIRSEVSPDAVAEHKKQFRAIMDKFGAETITNLSDADLPKAIAAIKAIKVEVASSDDDDLD